MLLYYFIFQHGFLGASHGSWRLEEGIGVLFFLLSFAVCRSYEIITITLARKTFEDRHREGKKIRRTNLQMMLLSRI
jgi:hypothetical protein